MVEIFNSSVGCAVQATGNIKWYQIVISSIQLLTFPVAYVLFSMGMRPYAALVTMVTLSVIAVLVRLYYIKHLLMINPREYFIQVLLRCAFIALLALAVPAIILINMETSLLRFLAITVFSTLSTAAIVYMLGVSESERFFLKGIVCKVFCRT